MAVIEVICVHCSSNNVVKNGKSLTGEQRYKCRAFHCEKTFQLVHRYNACEKGVRERMVDMALNGSEVRDTARVLSVGVSTVIMMVLELINDYYLMSCVKKESAIPKK